MTTPIESAPTRCARCRGRVIVAQVEVADRMAARLVGLLGRSGLPDGRGLWIVPCSGIHTMGMRFAIDAIFLDRALRVLSIERGIAPGRLVRGPPGAHSVLELGAGWLPEDALRTGDLLEFPPVLPE